MIAIIKKFIFAERIVVIKYFVKIMVNSINQRIIVCSILKNLNNKYKNVLTGRPLNKSKINSFKILKNCYHI